MPVRVNRRLRIVPIGGEEFTVVLPEKHPLMMQPAASMEALHPEPVVLLATSVDPARVALDSALRRAGASGFRTMDAESIPELLDYVTLAKRVALVPLSTKRFLRAGVTYKPVPNAPRANLGIIMRSDDRRTSAVSLIDAVVAFSAQDRLSS